MSVGHRVISAKHIKQSRIDLLAGEDRFVDDATYLRWMKSSLRRGDVLVTSEAPLGEVAFVHTDREWCLGQRLFGLRPNSTLLDGRFLFYALRSRPVRDDLLSRATGTTAQGIRQPELLKVMIPVPPLDEQRSIAELLGALDDKIDLNSEIQRSHEQLGRGLFKRWFVDVELKRGALPDGWHRRPLVAWVDAMSGGTPSKSNVALWGGDLPWISPKVMTGIHADEADAFVTPSAIGNGTRLAPKGSTLIMVRGMGLHQRVRVSQARREVAFNQDVKALVPRGIEPSLLLFAMLDAQADLLGRVESSGHGTGVLPTEILLAHPIAMPPGHVQKELAKPFDLINDRIAVAREESRTLAALRDLLLPKLLSGELRVRDAQRAVEAAAS
jgi:type I restriction enzyme S subunit